MKNSKVLFDTPYIKVKEAPNDKYFYSERKGIDSVAFILKDSKKGLYGLISERKPPLDERVVERAIRKTVDFDLETKKAFLVTAFGGSNDKIDIETYKNMGDVERITTFMNTVVDEVREEAGFKIKPSRVSFCGKVFVSTQQNQFCYLYVVDVTDIKQGKPEYENAVEAESEVVWKTRDEIIYDVEDWKAKTILFQTKDKF